MTNQIIPSIILFSVLLVGCTSEKDRLHHAIDQKEKELLADSLKAIDHSKAREMIALYEEYAKKYQQDTMSYEYIFKAADISNGIGEYRQAIDLYKQVAAVSSFRKNAVALFLQGFIYENQLKDYFQARMIYEDFLKKYPDHALKNDVTYSLKNLGKTPEELMKEFENNQHLQDSLAAVRQ